MKLTKREVLKKIMSQGHCWGLECRNCSYFIANECKLNMRDSRLMKIGAMAILRMFPEKKKPILGVGTKIKFDNGEIATIVYLRKEIILFFESHKEKLDYLIGKTWEIIE